MPTFNSFRQNKQHEDVYETVNNIKEKGSTFLPKVFGVMFLGLLGTTIVGFLISYLISFLYNKNYIGNEAYSLATLFTMLAGGIGVLIISIIVPMILKRGKHSILPSFILYSIFMGMFLSALLFYTPSFIFLESVGITSLIFGIISFLGIISKGRLKGLGMVIFGLFFGIVVLSLINWILSISGLIDFSNTISWLSSYLFFLVVMLVTLFDVNRISTIARNGADSDNNLLLYCAMMIFSDFIMILIRIIAIVGRFASRR